MSGTGSLLIAIPTYNERDNVGALLPALLARYPDANVDHPPLSMLLGRLGLELAGEPGRLALRVPFTALFAGTTWLFFLLGERLFGAWAGFWAALLLNLSPIFTLSVGLFFQPEGPLMFFWVACAWCLAHVLLGAPARRALGWWAAAGAMLGLGMLSKYAAVLLVAGAGLYVLTRREQRHWLRHPGPYLALAIALVIFSPVVVWSAAITSMRARSPHRTARPSPCATAPMPSPIGRY